jgi:glycine dehydrogenase subunit 1
MPYIPNTPDDQRAMLEAIGAASLDELFDSIPRELRLARPLDLPAAMSELELTAHMQRVADASAGCASRLCFLGAGSYDHFIPAVVDYVASRSEFYTAYTPYQPEAGQGTLQAAFEYQTLLTQLTGMDVANTARYSGWSVEATTMRLLRPVAAIARKTASTVAVPPS